MYKLLKTEEGIMDRFIYLKNEETGTVDYCFDFAVGSLEGDFSFMKIDAKYDCKIELFGKQVSKEKGAQKFYYSEENAVTVGTDKYLRVKIKEDVYYIAYEEVKPQSIPGFFYYYFSRKDLLEVDGLITPLYR